MKQFRKWNRILHRDIGYFFVGASIIYGISGIALNHLSDWNPNYMVRIEKTMVKEDLSKPVITEAKIINLLKQLDAEDMYKSYNYIENDSVLRIYLTGRSSVTVDLESGLASAEFLTRRPIFYHTNFLHYNPNRIWTWFSDIFAGALIFFALSSFFMIKGKKGAWGRGGIYIIAGIIIPLVYLFLYL
jgi:uncharacterized protein